MVDDMEFYDWEKSVSRANVERTLKQSDGKADISDPKVQAYAEAVVGIFDEGFYFKSLPTFHLVQWAI